MTTDDEAEQIADLRADNARLRRLLDQRDAPAELRHRLRGTLALLRHVIQHSAEAREGVAAYAAQLDDRLKSLMRVHEAVDLAGEVDLHAMVAEEFVFYAVSEGERLRIPGPKLLLKPRAAQVLGLAIHELAVNAVEHGAPPPRGRIDVSWRVEEGEPDPSLALTWTETGASGFAEPLRSGFGTTVLHEMVRYELGAEATLACGPDGLRYALRFPFPPRVGRIVASVS